MRTDPYNLARFVLAQNRNGAYARAVQELRAGLKRSHWMWFVFPQIAGLGTSSMARRYAIGSIGEAAAYLHHPALGPRLLECTEALLTLPGTNPATVLGGIDSIKLRSSITLFAEASDSNEVDGVLRQCLDRFFDGHPDEHTRQILKKLRSDR